MELHKNIQTLLEDLTLWLLNQHKGQQIQTMVDQYQKPITIYYSQLNNLLPQETTHRINTQAGELTAMGMKAEISLRFSQLEFLYYGLDVARVARECETKVITAAQIWYQLYEKFQGDWLNQAITNLPIKDQWQRKARSSLKQEFEASLAQLTQSVIMGGQDQEWALHNQALIERCLAILSELQSNTNINLAMLSVAVREIAKLKVSST
tara:strand:- start:544 stop:1170 length:627 start_codon:yes stop_codon:yes gene_type:complete